MPIVTRYEISRGRSSELEKTPVGTATIEMVDTNGSLDPASASAAYNPLTPVAIALHNPVTSTDSQIFAGHVARWGYKLYETERYGTATIECVDGMEILNAAEMTSYPDYGDPPDLSSLGDVQFNTADQVKHRIDKVLDGVGIAAGNREVFTGNEQLQKTVYSNRQPAINAVSDAAEAEFPGGVSNFFTQKNGKYTFHGRLARFNPTDASYHITTWKAGDIAAYNADPTRAVIFDLEYDRDKERIYNSVIATPEGIAFEDIEAQRVEDAASVATYGTRSLSFENLIVEHSWLTGNTAVDECREVFATYYTTNYSQPRTAIKKLTFQTVAPTHPWASNLWALMCGVDISDRIQVKTTHHGGVAGFDEYYFVEGLHYEVTNQSGHPDYMWVTLDLDVSPAAYWNTLP